MKIYANVRRVAPLIVFHAFALLVAVANAAIVPGPPAFPTGTTVAARPELAGVVLADVFRPFSFQFTGVLGEIVQVRGEIQDRVVRSDQDGTLDFYWRIINQSTASFEVQPMLWDVSLRNGFAGFTTDVDYRLDGLGTRGFFQGSRASIADDTVAFLSSDFEFCCTIGPGQSSYFWFIKTDATAFDESGSGSLSGVNFVNRDSTGIGIIPALFAPAQVPEPSSLLLALFGGAGLSLRSAKRRAAYYEQPAICARSRSG